MMWEKVDNCKSEVLTKSLGDGLQGTSEGVGLRSVHPLQQQEGRVHVYKCRLNWWIW